MRRFILSLVAMAAVTVVCTAPVRSATVWMGGDNTTRVQVHDAVSGAAAPFSPLITPTGNTQGLALLGDTVLVALAVGGPDGFGTIRQYDQDGNDLGTWASYTFQAGPRGLTIQPGTGHVLAGDNFRGAAEPEQVSRFNKDTGAFMGTFTSGLAMNRVWDLDYGPDGNLYVNDNAGIHRFNGTTGALMQSNIVTACFGVAFDDAGFMYTVRGEGPASERVSRYLPNGTLVTDSVVSSFTLSNGQVGGETFISDWDFDDSGNMLVILNRSQNRGVHKVRLSDDAYLGLLAAWTSTGQPYSVLFVPEPATLGLLGLGGLMMLRRRR